MSDRLEDRNVEEISRLPAPREFVQGLAASPRARACEGEARRAIRDVLHGRDPGRLVGVVGPCSIHDTGGALVYADRLARVAEDTARELVLVMRCYFEKPRTSIGWKGLLHDPDLDGSGDLGAGLERARRLLVELAERGIPCGGEALDPISPQYLADLLSWAAIGARTCESQIHRELASGLSMPVGFKNPTSGDLGVVANAIRSARGAHTFLGIDAQGAVAYVRTRGNPDLHLVLRGGARGPNFGPRELAAAAGHAAAFGLRRAVLVDCSHANSGGDHRRQARVCRAVLRQFRGGQRALMGVMLESQLQPGRQDWSPGAVLAPGLSITDACIGWDETRVLLYEAADAVARGRASA